MRFSSIALLGAFVAGVIAAPSPERYVVHEKRDGEARAWKRGNRLHSRATMPMRIGLKQSNLDKGHDMLMGV